MIQNYEAIKYEMICSKSFEVDEVDKEKSISLGN